MTTIGLTEEQKNELAVHAALFSLKYNIPIPELQEFIRVIFMMMGMTPGDKVN